MMILDWLLRLLILGGLGLLWVAYLRGWRRWRRVDAGLASPLRLVALALSTGLILVAFFPPLDHLSRDFLFMRALQQMAVAFVAAPLLWLAAPLHLISCGLPLPWRRRWARWLQPQRWSGRLTRAFTQPAVAWLAFVTAIVLWHETAVVNWTMQQPGIHLLLLGIFFCIALLYWGHLTGTGLRRLHRVPGWVLFAYVVGVEIPNMATGMTIAYAGRPAYAYYVTTHAQTAGMSAIEDQMMSGGLIWFIGSFVFFGSAVLIINRLFRRHNGDSPHHFPDWDSEERMIAPGLEHRLKEKGRRY